MAARGDEYLRKLLQKGGHLPKCFSPTINSLTFAYVLQIAAAKNLFSASQDIKYAYLNAEMPIITKLDDNIAKICGLQPGRLYRIMKAMYGLPASGRYWYLHYTERLKAEGYAQSDFDPCLFYRITADETTYICLFVDDTYNKAEHVERFVNNMRKYYQQIPWIRLQILSSAHPTRTRSRRLHDAATAQATRKTVLRIPS